MKILLIAGHGQNDPGAVGHGYKEADLTREFVAGLTPLLTPYADVDVYDVTKKLSYQLATGLNFNFRNYDYVLEIHFNAFKMDYGDGKNKGVEILVHPYEKQLIVEQNIIYNINKLGFTNRGIKRRTDLIVMNMCKEHQKVSYALLEACFVDDADDIQLYQKTKKDYWQAVANGIIDGFGLNKVENTILELVEVLTKEKIITDQKLWIDKASKDEDVYWLIKKTSDILKEKQK